MPRDNISRRSALGLLGGALGVGAIGTATQVISREGAAQSGGAPAVEWKRQYETEEENYYWDLPDDVIQMADGGYVLPGGATKQTKTGEEQRQFALVRTDSEGRKQSSAFAEPDRRLYRMTNFDLVEDGVLTSDDGVAMVGTAEAEFQRGERSIRRPVGVAAKFTQNDERAWTATVAATEDTESEPDKSSYAASAEREQSARLVEAVPTGDGGLVAVGNHHTAGLFVRFDADGNVTDEIYYEGYVTLDNVFTRDGGYTLIAAKEDESFDDQQIHPHDALHVTETGEVEETIPLDQRAEDNSVETINYTVTDDGGFAYAGSTGTPTNFVLGKLDASGSYQWSQQYAGPYEGQDYAYDLVQTADGGYAVCGTMQEAYSGDNRAAVVRTDAEGNEQWEKLVEKTSSADNIIRTADGGYAFHAPSRLVKLGPVDDSTATATATSSPTATETEPSTETETDTATETTTPEDDATETDTTTETDSGGGSSDEDDCKI